MKVTTTLLSLGYEIEFKAPAFAVPKTAVNILEAFYEALNPRVPLNMSDMGALTGNALADVAVRINLLGGVMEVGVDKFSAKFRNLRTEGDIALIKECLTLGESALSRSLEFETKRTTIQTGSWLACDAGRSRAYQVFDAWPASAISLEAVGASEFSYRPTGRGQSAADGWDLTFALEKSAVQGADFFFVCDVGYLPNSRYASLDEREVHVRSLMAALLGHLGFDFDGQSGGQPVH